MPQRPAAVPGPHPPRSATAPGCQPTGLAIPTPDLPTPDVPAADLPAPDLPAPDDPGGADPTPRWRNRLVDLAWLLVYVVGGLLVMLIYAGETGGRSLALDLPLGLVGLVALVLRRRLPWLTYGVGLGGSLVMVVVTGNDLMILVLLALYRLAVDRPPRQTWWALAGAGAGCALHAAAVTTGVLPVDALLSQYPSAWSSNDQLVASGVLVLVLALVTLVGTTARSRRERRAALAARARDREREREQRARLAVSEERSRIAREMHDVVAHSLAVMVALADGASQSGELVRAQTASARAADTGRQALQEMRQVLRVLDPDEPATLVPQPGLADLPILVTELRQTGLPLVADLPGEPVTVPPALGLTVYRLVQESLTNVLRHSRGPSLVELVVELDPTPASGPLLRVRVVDDGRPGPSGAVDLPAGDEPRQDGSQRDEPGVPGSSGRGLLGMGERVAAAGGRLRTGPGPEGGWQVLAELPLPVETGPGPRPDEAAS